MWKLHRDNRRVGSASILVTLCLAATACGGDSEADASDPIELTYAHYIAGPEAAQTKSIEKWADAAGEATDGQLDIEFFYAGGLLGAEEMLPGIADGRADIGYVGNFYFPSELPLTSVAEVPFVTSNLEAQVRAFEDMYETNDAYRQEWEANNVHVLAFAPTGVNVMGSSSKLAEPEDLSDQKVRAVGLGVSKMIEHLGGSVVAMSFADIYEGIQRGTIDAFTDSPMGVLADFGLEEVAPHITDSGSGTAFIAASVINLDTWNSLPEDVRTAVEEAADEYTAVALEDVSATGMAVCDTFLEAEGSFTQWSEADVASTEDAIGGQILDDWVTRVGKSVGEDVANEFLEDFLAAVADNESKSDYVSSEAECAEKSAAQ